MRETMTTLENRPNTALLVVDVQNGVVGGLTSGTRSSRTSPAWSRRRGRSRSLSSGSSTPTRAWPGTATLGDCLRTGPRRRGAAGEKSYGDLFEDTTLETVLASLAAGRLVIAGAETDACIRSTLHGALVRGYDATLVSDAHTTGDQTAWGAPPPDQVIAHTNLYWTFQRAPGRTAGTVETKAVNFGHPS